MRNQGWTKPHWKQITRGINRLDKGGEEIVSFDGASRLVGSCRLADNSAAQVSFIRHGSFS
jgi:hypothetical protein